MEGCLGKTLKEQSSSPMFSPCIFLGIQKYLPMESFVFVCDIQAVSFVWQAWYLTILLDLLTN